MPATYSSIATTTLGSATVSYTFSSISGSYTDLVLIAQIKGDTTGLNAALRFNSDSSTNYSYTGLVGNGSTAISMRSAENFSRLDNYGGPTTTEANFSITNIFNYSNTATYKTNITRSGRAGGATETFVNLWRSTSAITSIEVFARNNSFAAGSTFTLYGILSAA